MSFNKLCLLCKPTDVQLGTIPENARIGDFYQYVKFHACFKKSTICLKFVKVMPLDQTGHSTVRLHEQIVPQGGPLCIAVAGNNH